VFILFIFFMPCTDVAACRVTSSIFSADARFVLSGSDDGNVRIWKAKASDKLGVVTARERAAMEYRNSLKERWRVDSEVDRVARFVVSSCSRPCWQSLIYTFYPAHDTYQSLCIRLQNLRIQCWRRDGSKTKEGGSIRGSERASQSPNGRK